MVGSTGPIGRSRSGQGLAYPSRRRQLKGQGDARGLTKGNRMTALTSSTDQQDAPLEIETLEEDGTYVIRLRGELDLSSCDALDAALREAEDTPMKRILLDVDALRFIDSSGLQVILRAKRRSDSTGRRLRITRGTGHVADMFRLTALDMTLPFADGSDT